MRLERLDQHFLGGGTHIGQIGRATHNRPDTSRIFLEGKRGFHNGFSARIGEGQ